ncbi:MAG: hypothetical protein ACKO6F_11250 [Cyanobium sp.]
MRAASRACRLWRWKAMPVSELLLRFISVTVPATSTRAAIST